jgi:transposase
MSDALGNPMDFILTEGERADCTQALQLLEGKSGGAVLADKGYDADYIEEAILAMDAKVVIPPRSNRKAPREYDTYVYKERGLIECMFNKMKHFRGIATRYCKLALSYLAFLHLAAIIQWLK